MEKKQMAPAVSALIIAVIATAISFLLSYVTAPVFRMFLRIFMEAGLPLNFPMMIVSFLLDFVALVAAMLIAQVICVKAIEKKALRAASMAPAALLSALICSVVFLLISLFFARGVNLVFSLLITLAACFLMALAFSGKGRSSEPIVPGQPPYGVPQQPPYGAPQQPPYGAPQQQYAPYGAPVKPIKVNRGLAKYILLSIITFGIYPLVFMSGISTDINLIASHYDGKKTMHFCLVFFIFSWLTFGIVPIVWYHNLSARIGRELGRRGIGYSFGAGSFWGWNVLGSLIFVGPFIYLHKLCKSMNLLAGSYNVYG